MRPGEPIWWHRSIGGGGGSGHRPTPTEPVPAMIVRVGKRRVQIRCLRWEGDRDTWVDPSSVTARTTPTTMAAPQSTR